MIGSLRGKVLSVRAGMLLLECSGVGFALKASPAALSKARVGEEAFVVTTLAVSQDALTLYAFADEAEREAFTAVQTVSGIGPRIALAILAQLTPAQLAAAVASADTAQLQRVPGIGRKSAQRLVLELAGKLVGVAGDGEPASAGAAAGGEVVAALTGLGWSESQAQDAVAAALAAGDPGESVQSLLKASLRQLGGKA